MEFRVFLLCAGLLVAFAEGEKSKCILLGEGLSAEIPSEQLPKVIKEYIQEVKSPRDCSYWRCDHYIPSGEQFICASRRLGGAINVQTLRDDEICVKFFSEDLSSQVNEGAKHCGTSDYVRGFIKGPAE